MLIRVPTPSRAARQGSTHHIHLLCAPTAGLAEENQTLSAPAVKSCYHEILLFRVINLRWGVQPHEVVLDAKASAAMWHIGLGT